MSTSVPGPLPDNEVPASVARIRRLEQLELERLDALREREERRHGHVASARATNHSRVEAIERLTKYPMTALGIAWLVLIIIISTTHLTSSQSTPLVAAFFAIWVAMFVEYFVRLILSPQRSTYVKQRWIEPVTVVLPLTQGWHIVGLERVTLIVHEGLLRLAAILRHHSLFRVLGGAVGIIFAGAWLVLLFEKNFPGANIKTYQDAVWWAIVTVTTVGYGDKYPFTEGGRAVAIVLMLVGIGLIGTLTATVASMFVKEHTDSNKAEFKRSHDDLTEQIALISDLLQDVERRLGASVSDENAIKAEAEAEVAADDAAANESDDS